MLICRSSFPHTHQLQENFKDDESIPGRSRQLPQLQYIIVSFASAYSPLVEGFRLHDEEVDQATTFSPAGTVKCDSLV